MRSLPLLPPARPVHLTVHPAKAVLVVACQGSDKLWELRCMHPVTGALSLSLVISFIIIIIISQHHSSSSSLPNQALLVHVAEHGNSAGAFRIHVYI